MFAQKLNFGDVLLVPKKTKISSRSRVDLYRTIKFKNSQQYWRGVPIVTSNMDTIGTKNMYKPVQKRGMITVFNKHIKYYPETMDQHRFMYSCGMDTSNTEEQIKKFRPSFVCFDVANGYMEKYHEVVKKFREKYKDITLCVGNVVTPEMVEYYIKECGVDIVKVGIGSGSVCTTRNKTGVGFPQLSCVLECSQAAHEAGGYLMSDGGIREPGDVVKALAAGADFVMLGGILSGHDENVDSCSIDDQILIKDDKKYLKFYGMSSQKANDKYAGGTKDYRTAEGKEIIVEYKGKVDNTLQDILGGVRSGCSYLNCGSIEEIPRNAKFILGK